MKTILASVYAVNPYKGSEDGTGWNFVLQIARFNKVIAITRENNMPAIEKYMRNEPKEEYRNIRFVYFDTPKWMRFWKKGENAAMVYYLLWQFMLPNFVRKQKLKFDVVHSLNFHNDWSPSFLWKLKKPMVWGPVGHHPLIPKNYLNGQRWARVKDLLRWTVKNYFWRFDPFLRKCLRNSSKVLVMHSKVETVLNLPNEKKVALSQVAAEDMAPSAKEEEKEFVILSVGRFVHLKGFDIALKSFAEFYNSLDDASKAKVKFKMIGKGPDDQKLKMLIKEYKLSGVVEVLNWMSKPDLDLQYRKASLFLFPSHEGAGMVVAEALSYGLPILCFDNCGPGELSHDAGVKIAYSNVEESISAFATQLKKLYYDTDTRKRLGAKARKRFESYFRWDRKGEILKDVYSQV